MFYDKIHFHHASLKSSLKLHLLISIDLNTIENPQSDAEHTLEKSPHFFKENST